MMAWQSLQEAKSSMVAQLEIASFSRRLDFMIACTNNTYSLQKMELVCIRPLRFRVDESEMSCALLCDIAYFLDLGLLTLFSIFDCKT